MDNLYQARQLATLICSSEEAIDALIAHCDIAAQNLSVVLRVKRQANVGWSGDQIIRDAEIRKALAMEHQRRADWRKREFAASRFPAEFDQLNAAMPSRVAPDRVILVSDEFDRKAWRTYLRLMISKGPRVQALGLSLETRSRAGNLSLMARSLSSA